ncbi:MAG: DUF447 family protein [Deltaproteobacteria bacterium]|nr:DUF447 family protein [Deltaproteobacteria bacterium]
MNALNRIGMNKGWIYEVIVFTCSDIIPHVAPFGIWTQNFNTLMLNIYKDSTTLENILRDREFSIHFPKDVSIFYKSLFDKDALGHGTTNHISAPIPKDDSSFIDLEVCRTRDQEQTVYIEGGIVNLCVDKNIKLFNRAERLVLESLILATKQAVYPKDLLKANLKENYRIIQKVAPNSNYIEMMAGILEQINVFDPQINIS